METKDKQSGVYVMFRDRDSLRSLGSVTVTALDFPALKSMIIDAENKELRKSIDDKAKQ